MLDLLRRHPLALAASIALCLGAAALGGAATSASVDDWYQTLARPPLNPPDWIFAPVWTGLFVLMGIAAWRIWGLAAGTARHVALGLFGAQLVFNVLWSVLFFGLQRADLALVEIIVLEGLIIATTCSFWRIDRLAGALLLPYALWVAFAIYLNLGIWWLN